MHAVFCKPIIERYQTQSNFFSAEASCSVESLKRDLAVMEKDLAEASHKAERVLSEVCLIPFLRIQ